MQLRDTALVRHLRVRSDEYFGKFLELSDEMRRLLEYVPATFPHYTSHTATHSDEIITQLSQLLFNEGDPARPVVEFSGVELYILLASAYLHDSGMVVSDDEKARLLVSDEWRAFISDGGPGQEQFVQVEAFRQGSVPPDASLRNFLADRQLRILIADYFRRGHADRSRTLIVSMSDALPRLDFGDRSLQVAVGKVCSGHGLDRRVLEDAVAYPDLTTIRGEPANIRFLALLLRIGDLLDMSAERACPLVMGAATPLPTDSIAHWTKYSGITSRTTDPREIGVTAECRTQDEHRFMRDWCDWIVDEVTFAAVIAPRFRRHSAWTPPRASIDSAVPTIRIGPAATATYIPGPWRMELDHQTIFDRLVRDVYPHPLAFVRELLQNGLDATRCRMYDDLPDGAPSPPNPAHIEPEVRDRYPLRVQAREVSVVNEVSGAIESRYELSVEDSGIGMDEETIQRYLLQVGRSYYVSADFRNKYGFMPTSRFRNRLPLGLCRK